MPTTKGRSRSARARHGATSWSMPSTRSARSATRLRTTSTSVRRSAISSSLKPAPSSAESTSARACSHCLERCSRILAQASASCSLGCDLHRCRGQFADQTDQGCHLGLLEQVAAVALDELDRPLLVAGGERVIDRLTDQSVLGEPLATRCGAALRPARAGHARAGAAGTRRTGGDSGTTGRRCGCRNRSRSSTCSSIDCPSWHAGQRGRQFTADSLGDRGRQQEVEHRRFQRVQHVLGEELADRVVATGHRADQPRRVLALAQRQRRQLQRRHPAVGRGGEILDIAVVEVQPAQRRPESSRTRRHRNAVRWSRSRPARPAPASGSSAGRAGCGWSPQPSARRHRLSSRIAQRRDGGLVGDHDASRR